MSQYPAVIALSDLDGVNGVRLDGVAGGDFSGWSVASAGDVNGDGFADVIVGAISADPHGGSSGSSYIVFGKASGLDATFDLSTLDGANGVRIDGVASADASGRSVASAGDVNGDGFCDVIIGAYGADPNGSLSGSSYVVFGKASGFSATLDLSALDGTDGFRLDGAADSDFSGWSVASAGDVDGDGFCDMIVGAFNADPNGASSGSSYVVFGRASGFNATLDLSALNGTDGFRIDGVSALDESGWSVASAGDVNGDGFADIVIGSYAADPHGFGSGSSYVVFGKAAGFSATLGLSTLDGSNGFRIDGAASQDYSGRSVASAGDVNGDGYGDLIIGADGADPHGSHSGSSYVVFGKASGFAATMDLSALDGIDGFRLDGAALDDGSGRQAASAGDVNGDGFDDLIVCAYGADPHGSQSGSSYVVFGKRTGFNATLDLSTLNGTDGFRLDGVAADSSSRSAASAGDVNGDGLDDLIVGAAFASPHGSASGSSYVVFGRLPETAVHRDGTNASQSLVGGDFKDELAGRGGDDLLWGHGGKDALWGGLGDDTLIGGAGRDKLSGQAGHDHFLFQDLSDSPTADRDLIKDLEGRGVLGPGDFIDLSGVDANTLLAGDQAFIIVSAFSHAAGELRLTTSPNGHRTMVEGDVDGDGVADLTIKLKGDHHDFVDFVL